MGNSGLFPQGKQAATESRYPFLTKYKVHAEDTEESGEINAQTETDQTEQAVVLFSYFLVFKNDNICTLHYPFRKIRAALPG